jgi:SAM-dependent methyltransferase
VEAIEPPAGGSPQRVWTLQRRAPHGKTRPPAWSAGHRTRTSLLLDAVGERGRVIGVDLSAAMLEQARMRVERRGWRNVDLVCVDLADYRIASDVNGILSTLAITLTPAYDEAIRRGALALAPGGRLAVLGTSDLRTLPLGRPGAVRLRCSVQHATTIQ